MYLMISLLFFAVYT